MIKIVLILLTGIITGYILRKKDLTFVHKSITLFIWGLLFFLGVSVGINETLLSNLPTLGIDALVITAGGLAGSLLMAWLIYWRFFSENKPEGK
ncbi:MAG: LysO family transporter [Bacteroidales bacterium]